jgi:hypothetical protein
LFVCVDLNRECISHSGHYTLFIRGSQWEPYSCPALLYNPVFSPKRLALCVFRFVLVSCLAYSSTLKIEAIFSSGTLLDCRQTARRYITRNRILHECMFHDKCIFCVQLRVLCESELHFWEPVYKRFGDILNDQNI